MYKENYAVCIVNGKIKDISYYDGLLKSSSLTVCADGGANHLYKTNYKVDCLVGDMDSIDSDALSYFEKNCEVRKYKREKDYTDSMIAIDLIIEYGIRQIYMIGAFGDRADHFLSNVGLLFFARGKDANLVILDDINEIFLLSEGKNTLHSSAGQTVSFVPLSDVRNLTLEGFKYPLQDHDVHIGDSRLNSNIAVQKEQTVSFESGKLLCININENEDRMNI